MHERATHPTGIPRQDRQSWSRWPIVWSVTFATVLGFTLLSPSTVLARTFQCRAMDVACLIASIAQANAQPGNSHEIRLAAGIYTLTAVDNETNGPNGLPSVTSPLTIRGVGEDVTILERNVNTAPFRLLHVAATGALTLEGLTLRGGGARLVFRGDGGGLYNAGGTLTILNSTVVRNAGLNGGGLYSTGGRVTILRSSVVVNDTSDMEGLGGGLFVTGGAAMTISDSTVAQNYGDTGGGGLYVGTGATGTITNSAILSNGATIVGGGLLNAGTLTITNSTIARNFVAQGVGGGVYGNSTTRILNSTIVENLTGGAVPGTGVIGPVVLQNTVVAHNIYYGYGAPSDCMGTISLGHNLIGDPAGCDMTLLSSDVIGPPGLGAFVDDETPGSAHYPLLEGSLAIDKGNPAACPKTDQLGEKRVGPCDIGAIEFQGTAVSRR